MINMAKLRYWGAKKKKKKILVDQNFLSNNFMLGSNSGKNSILLETVTIETIRGEGSIKVNDRSFARSLVASSCRSFE